MDIDATISQVERLYQSVTGQEMPPASPASEVIPPERDPRKFLDEQLERLGQVLGGLTGSQVSSAPSAPAWTPPLSAWEKPTEYLLTLAVPGVPRDRIRILRSRDSIIVEGDRPAPEEVREQAALAMSEGGFGPFRRVVAMPAGANLEEIQATLRDGLLVLRVSRGRTAGEEEKLVPLS